MANGRSLGFRLSTDPWAILVAETMAHQTQIERVDAAWAGFMASFPTPQALVAAGPGDAVRAWQGLGYNRRAVNLYRAAQLIVEEHDGRVPSGQAALRALPGVGPYTARAVAATAFGRPVGAVDTNVRRVLSRITGVGQGPAFAGDLQSLADAVVPPRAAAAWTHALMDLGSLVCRRAAPRCGDCPAAPWCKYAASELDPPVATGPGRPAGGGRPARGGRRARPARPSLPFERTSRWLRGRIVARLSEAPPGSWVRFDDPIGVHDGGAVAEALVALERDGLLERDAVEHLSARLPGYAIGVTIPLPASDRQIFELDVNGLAERWADAMAGRPMTAEEMMGADRRAQALGVPGADLMENAGTAVAAAAHALAVAGDRWGSGPILVLCGPGNNGGDGFVAARRLAEHGADVLAVLVASEPRPGTPDALRNWDRLDRLPRVTKIHAAVARDIAILGQGVERAALVIDALLGTGVHGTLRDPILVAVELVQRARRLGVPVVAVDTPTAVDLSSGEPTDPVVQADLTVTFHRPKAGLLTRRGRLLAGRVLVAPIGIPLDADRG